MVFSEVGGAFGADFVVVVGYAEQEPVCEHECHVFYVVHRERVFRKFQSVLVLAHLALSNESFLVFAAEPDERQTAVGEEQFIVYEIAFFETFALPDVPFVWEYICSRKDRRGLIMA